MSIKYNRDDWRKQVAARRMYADDPNQGYIRPRMSQRQAYGLVILITPVVALALLIGFRMQQGIRESSIPSLMYGSAIIAEKNTFAGSDDESRYILTVELIENEDNILKGYVEASQVLWDALDVGEYIIAGYRPDTHTNTILVYEIHPAHDAFGTLHEQVY